MFWKYPPDVLTAFERNCTEDGGLQFWSANHAAYDGLFNAPEFREAYKPVAFNKDGQCWPGFAQVAWLDTVQLDGLRVFDWADVQMNN